MKRDLVIFIDSGDTLVDESTEIRDAQDNVARADLFPGAADTLRTLHRQGYTIALVADGTRTSFDNVYRQHGLEACFDARAISGDLGQVKPSAIMFRAAMQALGLTDGDLYRIVMIGNNLGRDIVGANRMGITSILASYSPRYVMRPADAEQVPDYVVASPAELVPLLDELDRQVRNRRVLGPEAAACLPGGKGRIA